MDCWDFVVLVALAFDMRNLICACNDLRCGGAETKLSEVKQLVANMPLPRNSAEPVTVFLKSPALSRVGDS